MQQINHIIENLLQDSPKAMELLFELFYKPLCFYAVRYAQNMQVAEEIVSDVMYKIWQNRLQGYRAETFREYLFTATRNTAINYLRQKKKQKELTDNWAEQFRGELIEETPLDIMITEEMQTKLNNLINSLPEQCRKVFIMSRFNEMTYDEIATKMNISQNTVKHHIKTALQKLRAGMGDFMLWLILFLTSLMIYIFTHLPYFHFQLYHQIVSHIP